MIVRFSGKDIHLSDDLYASVMRELNPCMGALDRAPCDPLIIDVVLVRRDPESRDVDTDSTYRTEVSITAVDQRISEHATSDSVRTAVKRTARRLVKKVEATYPSSAEGTAREPPSSGDDRSRTGSTDRMADARGAMFTTTVGGGTGPR